MCFLFESVEISPEWFRSGVRYSGEGGNLTFVLSPLFRRAAWWFTMIKCNACFISLSEILQGESKQRSYYTIGFLFHLFLWTGMMSWSQGIMIRYVTSSSFPVRMGSWGLDWCWRKEDGDLTWNEKKRELAASINRCGQSIGWIRKNETRYRDYLNERVDRSFDFSLAL